MGEGNGSRSQNFPPKSLPCFTSLPKKQRPQHHQTHNGPQPSHLWCFEEWRSYPISSAHPGRGLESPPEAGIKEAVQPIPLALGGKKAQLSFAEKGRGRSVGALAGVTRRFLRPQPVPHHWVDPLRPSRHPKVAINCVSLSGLAHLAPSGSRGSR